jgi:3-oxoacyl-[acyl-carrier protein] reductase
MSAGVSMDLTGRVALISGGSRGIGAACVRLFTRAGARVVFSYERAQTAAEALAAECGADTCHAVRAGLDSVESAEALVSAAITRFGRLDALVGNHGIWPEEDLPVEQMTPDHWRRTMHINLDSVFGLVRYSVPHMKAQGSGHIVLLSSTAGQRGEAFHADYAASKGAIISLVKGLSTELAASGIRVNCVAPGWVATDMTRGALADAVAGPAALRKIPLGRVGMPEEIAACVLFLCTAHAGFITGEVLNVNGGAVLAG